MSSAKQAALELHLRGWMMVEQAALLLVNCKDIQLQYLKSMSLAGQAALELHMPP